MADVDPDVGPFVKPPTELTTAASWLQPGVLLPCCIPIVTTTGRPAATSRLPPPIPALSLQTTALLDLHVDASQAVPPVMSTRDAVPRPTRTLPLWPQLAKPEPDTVADVHPDDGPFVKPPTELTIAAS